MTARLQGADNEFQRKTAGAKHYVQHTVYNTDGYVIYHNMMWFVFPNLQKVVGKF